MSISTRSDNTRMVWIPIWSVHYYIMTLKSWGKSNPDSHYYELTLFNLDGNILTHLAYIAYGKKSCSILQQFTRRKCMTLFGAGLLRHPSHRPCLLYVKRCNVVFFARVINVRNTCIWNTCICKRLGFRQCNGGKLEEFEGCNCFFIVSYVLESKYISSGARIIE